MEKELQKCSIEELLSLIEGCKSCKEVREINENICKVIACSICPSCIISVRNSGALIAGVTLPDVIQYCDDCHFLDPKERDQPTIGQPHRCTLYDTIIRHLGEDGKNHHPRISRPSYCKEYKVES